MEYEKWDREFFIYDQNIERKQIPYHTLCILFYVLSISIYHVFFIYSYFIRKVKRIQGDGAMEKK